MGDSEKNQSEVFERLLRPHMDRLYRLAFRLTHNKAEAEDLFQDVLTKSFGRLDDLQAVRDPGPWLNRVLYNHFVDNKRRYARQRLVTVEEGCLPEQSVEAFAGNSSPVHDVERLDDIMQLESALAMLSDEHRTVVLLHDSEGYKISEIQSLTGDPIGTIKSRLHRARARLRELMQEKGTFSRD
ncbi:MAG: RNA polymerase sigma factor [Gammaproteobacteria bacterium]|nr:RNA polymerase sigma factor [Gammaproteobacteria bacterium]